MSHSNRKPIYLRGSKTVFRLAMVFIGAILMGFIWSGTRFLQILRERSFFEAIDIGDESEVLLQLNHGIDPNVIDQFPDESPQHIWLEDLQGAFMIHKHQKALQLDRTALTLASMRHEPEIVRALLEKGSKVNAKNSDGSTALIWAAYSKSSEIAELLVEWGAEINALDDEGHTALGIASDQGAAAIVQLLISHGANIHARNKIGLNPIEEATRSGHLQIVKELVAAGANVNDHSDDGLTLVDMARYHKHLDVLRWLKHAGAKDD